MPFEIDAKHSGRDDARGEERGATKSADANRDGETGELMRPWRAHRAERKPADRPGDSEPRDKGAQKDTDERRRDGEAPSLIMRHPYMATAAALVVVLCVVAGIMWWLNARQYESTDDAFIDARTVSISSQVGGAIVDVPVTDNQRVDQGALLARIDDRDYRAALDLAVAQIDQAQGNIANLDAQIDAQQARIDQAHKQVTEAQAALSFAKDEDVRAQDLVRKGAGTLQRAQQTASDLGRSRPPMTAPRPIPSPPRSRSRFSRRSARRPRGNSSRPVPRRSRPTPIWRGPPSRRRSKVM
jgi:membrane fusion protein (multidrug efflux system)